MSKSTLESAWERVRESTEALGEAVKDRGPEWQERGKAARKKVAKRAAEARKTTGRLVERGRERAPELIGSVADRMPSVEIPHRKRRSLMGKVFSKFTVGFAIGYVLGAKAGRERYVQIRRWWDQLMGSPTVQEAAERGKQVVTEAGNAVMSEIRERTGA